MSKQEPVGWTVEEMRKKWCPHARALFQIQEPVYQWTGVPAQTPYPQYQATPVPNQNVTKAAAPYNRSGGGHMPYECQCLADQCGARRWVTAIEQPEKRGYCGAFGPPEG